MEDKQDTLSAITTKCAQLINQQTELKRAESMVETIKDQIKKIGEKEIPTLMEAAGISELTLSDGKKVSCAETVRAHIPSDRSINCERDPDSRAEKARRRYEARKILEAAGAADLYTGTVGVNFTRGSNLKKEAIDALIAAGLSEDHDFSVTESIHPQTLNAWVRENLENLSDEQKSALSVYEGKQTKIQ